MPRRGSPYGRDYQRARLLLLGLPCELRLVCDGAPGESADHVPPLSLHVHRPRSGCCVLRPACLPCQWEQGKRVAREAAAAARLVAAELELEAVPVPSRVW